MREPVLFGYPIHLLFLYFLIYSFLGWCMETAYCSIHERRLVPRGFLFGPICPIYGVGVLMMICWFAPLMGNPLLFYVAATVCMSAWEYFVGWFLETATHIKYWDYSMYKFNLNGRICLWVCLTWGVLAYIVLYWVQPAVSHLALLIPLAARHVLSLVLAAVLVADTVTTIRKLVLSAKLMRKLEEARVQLSLGRAELADALQGARDDISDKLAASSLERKVRQAENNIRLQRTYEELLRRAARKSRRFLNRYRDMSSKIYNLDLTNLRQLGAQVKQRLDQARDGQEIRKAAKKH